MVPDTKDGKSGIQDSGRVNPYHNSETVKESKNLRDEGPRVRQGDRILEDVSERTWGRSVRRQDIQVSGYVQRCHCERGEH